jgi:SsrA-binding protein
MEKAVNIQHRKARYDYHFIEEYIAGPQLTGSEVKSIRDSRVSLVDNFCYFENGELWARGINITPIDQNYVHEPLRPRKLLLHRKELNRLEKGLIQGVTIVVTAIFTTAKGRIKFKIALCRGKKDYDKRETIKQREAEREMKNVNNF